MPQTIAFLTRGLRTIELKVIEHSLGGNGVGGYFYTDHLTCSGVAIEPDSPEAAKLAYEVEAYAYNETRPPKGGRKFILESRDVENLDANAILAIRSVIDDLRPGWVEEVKDACRFADHPRVIAGYCEMSIAVVVAIIENLKARGEIPDADECA